MSSVPVTWETEVEGWLEPTLFKSSLKNTVAPHLRSRQENSRKHKDGAGIERKYL